MLEQKIREILKEAGDSQVNFTSDEATRLYAEKIMAEVLIVVEAADNCCSCDDQS